VVDEPRDQQKAEQPHGQRKDASGGVDELQAPPRAAYMVVDVPFAIDERLGERRVQWRSRRSGGDGRHGSIIGRPPPK
jgi:hypothetical protein